MPELPNAEQIYFLRSGRTAEGYPICVACDDTTFCRTYGCNTLRRGGYARFPARIEPHPQTPTVTAARVDPLLAAIDKILDQSCRAYHERYFGSNSDGWECRWCAAQAVERRDIDHQPSCPVAILHEALVAVEAQN